jgi:hypothetical protein
MCCTLVTSTALTSIVQRVQDQLEPFDPLQVIPAILHIPMSRMDPNP